MLTTTEAVDGTANQTVRLDLGTKDGVQSMRIGFTDQRLTAHAPSNSPSLAKGHALGCCACFAASPTQPTAMQLLLSVPERLPSPSFSLQLHESGSDSQQRWSKIVSPITPG
jgi:hypothetical protein